MSEVKINTKSTALEKYLDKKKYFYGSEQTALFYTD